MSVLLRNCILIQRKICFQKFTLQKCTIPPFPFNIDNVKVFAGSLQVKCIHTKGKNETDKRLIYTGQLKNRLYYMKAFSLLTSCINIAVIPLLYKKSLQLNNIIAITSLSTIVICYTVGTPLLIHYIIGKKYVLNIYFNSEKNSYIAETYNLFLKKLQIEFTEDDVRVPDITGPFTTCFVKGSPLFFNESGFTDLVHYHKIMGHYKPLDLFCIDDKDKIKDEQNNNSK